MSRKHPLMKYPIFAGTVVFIFLYDLLLHLFIGWKLNEKLARGMAVAMTFVLVVTSVDLTALALTPKADTYYQVSQLGEVATYMEVPYGTSLKDIPLPKTVNMVLDTYQVEVEEETPAVEEETPAAEEDSEEEESEEDSDTEGEISTLKDLDKNPDTITIKTVKLSAYVISYSDSDVAGISVEKVNATINGNTPVIRISSLGLVALALMSAGFVVYKKKKRR